VTAWVVPAQGWDVVEPGCLDHFGGHVTSKVRDLLPNVTEEGVAGPTAQKHDGVNRDVVEIHGHGCQRPAGVQSNGFGRDAKAAVVDGLDVGPEELESDGAGHIAAFPGGRHVGENK